MEVSKYLPIDKHHITMNHCIDLCHRTPTYPENTKYNAKLCWQTRIYAGHLDGLYNTGTVHVETSVIHKARNDEAISAQPVNPPIHRVSQVT